MTTCAQLLGMSVPLALSIGFVILGLVLMLLWWWRAPAFFRRPRETFQEDRAPAGTA